MAKLRITDLAIQRLPHPATGDTKHWDTVLPGFGVRVTSRTKSFFVSFGKKRQLKTLGRYPAVSLKDARQQAKAFQTAPTSKTKLTTLSEARTAFLDDCDSRLSPRTVQNYRILLARLTRDRLDQVLREDATDAHAVICFKAFFNWLIANERYDRNPFAASKVSIGKRTRLLSDDDIKTIWAHGDDTFHKHLKLLILTGQRRSQYSNFRIVGDAIVFPPEGMKGKKEHSIPLLPLAKALATDLRSFNGWSKAKARLDKDVPIDPWVIHDFRRYFSTTMAKRLKKEQLLLL